MLAKPQTRLKTLRQQLLKVTPLLCVDALINTCFIMLENVYLTLLSSLPPLVKRTNRKGLRSRWNNNGSEENLNPDQFSAYSEREQRKQMLKLKIRFLSRPILSLRLYFTAGGGQCDCDVDSTAAFLWKVDTFIVIVSIADLAWRMINQYLPCAHRHFFCQRTETLIVLENPSKSRVHAV